MENRQVILRKKEQYSLEVVDKTDSLNKTYLYKLVQLHQIVPEICCSYEKLKKN